MRSLEVNHTAAAAVQAAAAPPEKAFVAGVPVAATANDKKMEKPTDTAEKSQTSAAQISHEHISAAEEEEDKSHSIALEVPEAVEQHLRICNGYASTSNLEIVTKES